MMRKTLLVLISLAVFTSCDNDLKITADWKDVPVVYGILNAQDSLHYVKLNKAFLGQGDVMTMAQQYDSIYYNEQSTGLRLIEYRSIGGQYQETKSIEMTPTDEFVKPDGLFSSPNQIIYKTDESIDNQRLYSAQVYNKNDGSVIASNLIPIQVLSPLQIIKPNPASALNLVPNGNYPIRVEWQPLDGAALYELNIRFHYVEQQIADLSDTAHKYIDWVFPYRLPTSSILSESISLDAEQFLNFLAVNIDENPNVYRQVKGMNGTQGFSGLSITHSCLDINLLAAAQDLATYILLNQNSNSIVVDRPEYSNIENGIGIFSSRSHDLIANVKLNNLSNDEIAFNEITRHLNFAYFRLGDEDQIDTLYVN